MDDVVDVLQDILSELQELNRNLEYETRAIGEKLEQLSDGLFALNLHLDADVSAWTGGVAPTSSIKAGVVKWYDTAKGYGYVQPRDGSPDVFVHYSQLPPPGYLHAGQQVAYSVRQTENGPVADQVRHM